MKRILGITIGICFCISLIHAQQDPSHYTVEGILKDSTNHGSMIYITRYDDRKHIDSTQVKGNRFIFKGKIDTATFSRIQVAQQHANFILEPGDIKVNMNENGQPSGTPLNNLIATYATKIDSINTLTNQKRKELRTLYTDDTEFRKQMSQFYLPVREKKNKDYIELLRAHPNDAFGEYLLYYSSRPDDDLNFWESTLSLLGPWLHSRKMVQRRLVQLESLKKTAEGKPFTDIKGKDPEGNTIALSDFLNKGNYVLMDMWASWCGPCRREIPNLAKLHNQYKYKGLTVLGLYVWDKEENLKPAMESEQVTWPQIFDSEGNATQQYGVSGIPHIILFAPDGTILKRGLRGEIMIRAVNDIMNK